MKKPDLPTVNDDVVMTRKSGQVDAYTCRAAKPADLDRVNEMRKVRYHRGYDEVEDMNQAYRWWKKKAAKFGVWVTPRRSPKGIYVAVHSDQTVAAAFKIKRSRSGELIGDGLIADEDYPGAGRSLIGAVGDALPAGVRLNIKPPERRPRQGLRKVGSQVHRRWTPHGLAEPQTGQPVCLAA